MTDQKRAERKSMLTLLKLKTTGTRKRGVLFPAKRLFDTMLGQRQPITEQLDGEIGMSKELTGIRGMHAFSNGFEKPFGTVCETIGVIVRKGVSPSRVFHVANVNHTQWIAKRSGNRRDVKTCTCRVPKNVVGLQKKLTDRQGSVKIGMNSEWQNHREKRGAKLRVA